MQTRKINWWLQERISTYRKPGKEWALFVSAKHSRNSKWALFVSAEHNSDSKWAVWEWEKKPAESEVKEVIGWLSHAMNFALTNLVDREIPFLQVQRVKSWDKGLEDG